MQKGNLIFWNISDVETSKTYLESMGFDAPRNDFRTSLIKALKVYTTETDLKYRRFNDGNGECSFQIYEEKVEQGELEFDKIFKIILDKKDGSLSSRRPLAGTRLEDLYNHACETLDSNQLRNLILKVVKNECHAISMRPSGGIYFIDDQFKDTLDRLRDLFSKFDGAKLQVIPVYNNDDTNDAIETAATSHLTTTIESTVEELKKKFSKGKVERSDITAAKNRAKEAMEKIDIHKENLREAYEDLSKRSRDVSERLNKTIEDVERGNDLSASFLSNLRDL